MLRKFCQMASIALLGLLVSPASANHDSNQGPSSSSLGGNLSATEIAYLTATNNKSAGAAQTDSAKSAMEGQTDNLNMQSNPLPIEYPALALLAVAVISMAALSRRNPLPFDDNKR
jgi:hypothetical protein